MAAVDRQALAMLCRRQGFLKHCLVSQIAPALSAAYLRGLEPVSA